MNYENKKPSQIRCYLNITWFFLVCYKVTLNLFTTQIIYLNQK